MVSLSNTFILFCVLSCLHPSNAFGHAQYKPFSLTRYTIISFEPIGIHITYNLTVGDLPAAHLRKRFDKNSDGDIDRKEFEAMIHWVQERIETGISISLDGKPQSVQAEEPDVDLVTNKVEMFAPIWFRFYITIGCSIGTHQLKYNDHAEFAEMGQTELFIRRGPTVRIKRALRPQKDRGVVERMFWQDGKIPGTVLVDFELLDQRQVREDSRTSTKHADSSKENESSVLKRALLAKTLGPISILLALAVALGLGAIHALSPGHGKTLVAAYLVGSRGTVRHALVLGLLVTATHVFSVIVLGLVALLASESMMPDKLMPWTALAAGTLVMILGVWMLAHRMRNRHHEHTHAHEHSHSHKHSHEQHEHKQGTEVRWTELLALGISGGLIPCPSATVVLLLAIYVGKIGLGLAMIGAFSLGLAATLVVVGIIVVKARNLIERLDKGRFAQAAKLLPVLSAVLVLCIGGIMTTVAFVDLL